MRTISLMRRLMIGLVFVLVPVLSAQGGEIKIALDTPRNLEISGTYVWTLAFSDYVTSKGLETKLYERDALGGEEEKLDQVSQGLLEMSNSDLAKAGQIDPTVFGFYMPYMFDSMAHLDKVVANTDLMKRVNTGLSKRGARLMAIVPLGSFVGIINTKKPIATPADMKGLRFRALDNKQAAWLKAWDASAVVIPWPEIYSALQTGVVDGYLNVSLVPIMFKHTEVVKYFSDTKLCAPLRVVLCSDKWYSGLSDKERTIVDEGVVKANMANRAWLAKVEVSGKAALKDAGVQVYENTPEERAMFADLVRAHYDEMLDPAIVKVFVAAAKANR